MKEQLRKPAYWEDFEDLCTKLWGEIWKCPETKKNGRKGQTQHGVDIIGQPNNEIYYYGIQCKGKDEYVHAQLTTKEIDEEIGKAKLFKPALKMFYFATTANKDAKIEEYIRLKDYENRTLGLFGVNIFCWEDIVDKIDENKKTHDWYVKSIKFNLQHKAELTFANGKIETTVHPSFIKQTINYCNPAGLDLLYQCSDDQLSTFPKFAASNEKERFEKFKEFMSMDINEEEDKDENNPQPIIHSLDFPFPTRLQKKNYSTCTLKMKLSNFGSEAIEEFKIKLKFTDVLAVDTVDKINDYIDTNHYYYNILFYKENPFHATSNCTQKVLVQGDSFELDELCFQPRPNQSEVQIFWELLSKGYSNSGILNIFVEPNFQEETEDVYLDDFESRESILRFRNEYEVIKTL